MREGGSVHTAAPQAQTSEMDSDAQVCLKLVARTGRQAPYDLPPAKRAKLNGSNKVPCPRPACGDTDRLAGAVVAVVAVGGVGVLVLGPPYLRCCFHLQLWKSVSTKRSCFL